MMKRKILFAGLLVTMAVSMFGCGKADGENADSLDNINPDEYVTLGDYKNLEVNVDHYEVIAGMIIRRLTSRLYLPMILSILTMKAKRTVLRFPAEQRRVCIWRSVPEASSTVLKMDCLEPMSEIPLN